MVSFSSDHRTMYFRRNRAFRDATGKVEATAQYDIISVTPSRLRAQIRGELRKTSDGTPVIWDIVMKSHDRFAWHRTDWPFREATGDIVRCHDQTN